MRNFGYSTEAISQLSRALFLTKLHDKDLWVVWQLLHPISGTEVPLESGEVRHLLALLAEGLNAEQVAALIDRVDENRSGDVRACAALMRLWPLHAACAVATRTGAPDEEHEAMSSHAAARCSNSYVHALLSLATPVSDAAPTVI